MAALHDLDGDGLPFPADPDRPRWNEAGFARSFVETAEAKWRAHVESRRREREPSACAECGHLHFLGPDLGYDECPIDGCSCKGQS